jgi:hypothetical protein
MNAPTLGSRSHIDGRSVARPPDQARTTPCTPGRICSSVVLERGEERDLDVELADVVERDRVASRIEHGRGDGVLADVVDDSPARFQAADAALEPPVVRPAERDEARAEVVAPRRVGPRRAGAAETLAHPSARPAEEGGATIRRAAHVGSQKPKAP